MQVTIQCRVLMKRKLFFLSASFSLFNVTPIVGQIATTALPRFQSMSLTRIKKSSLLIWISFSCSTKEYSFTTSQNRRQTNDENNLKKWLGMRERDKENLLQLLRSLPMMKMTMRVWMLSSSLFFPQSFVVKEEKEKRRERWKGERERVKKLSY